jgi:hypothetical protein
MMPAGKPSFAKFGPEKRNAYLQLLRDGNALRTAARGVGVSPELVRLYRKATKGWRRQEEDARREAVGRVEDALFQAAVSGNVTAIQVYLYNRDPKRWQDRRNFKHQVGGESGAEVVVKVIGGASMGDL